MMRLRLCTEGEGVMLCLSMRREDSWAEGRSVLGSSDEEFCFIAVEFEKLIVHQENGGENDWGDGFGGDVSSGVVIAVEMKSVAAHDVSKG